MVRKLRAHPLIHAHLTQMFQISPLTTHTSQLKKRRFKNPFNRHAVVHGLECNYGTLLNSLRTVSWLSYAISLKEQEERITLVRKRKLTALSIKKKTVTRPAKRQRP